MSTDMKEADLSFKVWFPIGRHLSYDTEFIHRENLHCWVA
jgi:hypothetical protein